MASTTDIGPRPVSVTAPSTPEEARTKLDPYSGLSPFLKADMRKWGEKIRREDERIQYGSRAARVRKMEAKIRAAKRKTAGIKKVNPFIALAMKKKDK